LQSVANSLGTVLLALFFRQWLSRYDDFFSIFYQHTCRVSAQYFVTTARFPMYWQHLERHTEKKCRLTGTRRLGVEPDKSEYHESGFESNFLGTGNSGFQAVVFEGSEALWLVFETGAHAT
jgi:hypothetical protein